MTKNEHAQAIYKDLFDSEKALFKLHRSLAAAAAEYGEELGFDPELVTAAAAPKKPPVNPE